MRHTRICAILVWIRINNNFASFPRIAFSSHPWIFPNPSRPLDMRSAHQRAAMWRCQRHEAGQTPTEIARVTTTDERHEGFFSSFIYLFNTRRSLAWHEFNPRGGSGTCQICARRQPNLVLYPAKKISMETSWIYSKPTSNLHRNFLLPSANPHKTFIISCSFRGF